MRRIGRIFFWLSLVLSSGCSSFYLQAPSNTSTGELEEKNTAIEGLEAAVPPQRKPTPWDIASTINSNLNTLSNPQYTRAWEHRKFPAKRSNQFEFMLLDGRVAMQAVSSQSISMLRQSSRIEHSQLGRIQFSWKVSNLIAGADLNQRSGEDSPVRLVLVFEGDSQTKFSAKNAMLSELALTLTGEPLPYATLVYAWDNSHPAGSIFNNHRTDRIRKIVLESGPDNVGKWLDYDRDIRADFEKAFGEAPGALLSVGIMTDTDNTKTSTTAWYGPVRLLPQR